jgi:hypothetical protein
MAKFPARIAVADYAASELEIQQEVLECGDEYGRLISQWDGSAVVVFDSEHASALASIACEWGNSIDRAIEDGFYNSDTVTKRQNRAIRDGLYGLSTRLRSLTV